MAPRWPYGVETVNLQEIEMVDPIQLRFYSPPLQRHQRKTECGTILMWHPELGMHLILGLDGARQHDA